MAYNLLPGDYLKLMIVAKARMSNGFCYISWDKDRHKLVRTVLGKNYCRLLLAEDKDLKASEKNIYLR